MKKKVLFVFHESDPSTGGNASMLDVIKNIHRNIFFDILVLAPKDKSGLDYTVADVIKDMGVPVLEATYYSSRFQPHDIKVGSFLRILKCTIRNIISLLTSLRLIGFFKKEKISLIYSNTSDIYIGAILAKALKIKHVWHIREFGVEDQHAHHLIGDRFFYKMANYLSDEIIVISKSLESKVLRYISRDKVSVIYDDLLFPESNYQLITKREPGVIRPNILIVGTLSPGKGQLELIHTLARLKKQNINFKLGIAGYDNTSYADFLKKEVLLSNLEDNVIFLGFSNNLISVRNEYDIAVVASHSEAFGRVTIEGMLSGLIVLGINKGANPELINDHVSGFLYNDSDELLLLLHGLILGEIDIKNIRENARLFAMNFIQGRSSNAIVELIKQHLSISNSFR